MTISNHKSFNFQALFTYKYQLSGYLDCDWLGEFVTEEVIG